MENRPIIIGVDPSGSYNEGSGTTGLCVLTKDKLIEHSAVYAANYATRLAYWKGVADSIQDLLIKYPTAVLSIEDYVLYSHAAKAQINSEMETSKLIGALMLFFYMKDVKMYMRTASQVMKRWTNEILEHHGYVKIYGRGCLDNNDNPISKHSMDAIRHAVHCAYFELEKDKHER